MRRLRFLILLTIFFALFEVKLTGQPVYAAMDGITWRINNLKSKFPDGAYWNHIRQVSGDDGDTLLNNWNNSYGDYVSGTQCYTHNGVAAIGQYDCNAFDGAIQCYGFANKVFFDIFGQHCPNLSKRTDISNISIGDHIRFSTWGDTGHSAIVIARNGDTLTLVEGNYQNRCMIHWNRTVSLSGSGICGFIHASNWQQIFDDGPSGYLDVNGLLDGAESGSLGSMGTCDVYINGSLVANDVNDYYKEWASGTTWRIEDIKAADGYSYDGSSGSLSGTISSGSTTNIRLKFNSCILDINGYLDGKDSGDLGSYGTFDLYINGSPVRENVNDYSQRVTKGSSYEIRSIQAADGYTYDGLHAGSLTGTVGSGRTVVSLSFYKNGELSGDWIETDHLPGNVNDEICEIQYRYASTKVAAASPGAGWTQVAGSATTKYENIGGVYDNDLELPTSDTRVYVGSYYYHYCGASTGVNVEHYNDGVHTDLHIAGDINQFNVSGGPWADDNDPRYLAYEITWKSGQWAGGKATCSAGRSAIWYRKYQYQDRKAVTYYTWEKKTDWQSEQDTSLTPAGYRYRLKDAEDPTITSVTISGVTPSGYTLVCKASDNMGISKAVFVTWTDTETENAPIITEITPEKIDTTVEITADIPIADHSSERDVWYHTKVYVYDQAGHSAEYSDADCKTYIPTLIRSSARKLTLPAGLTEIEASAFEGSIGAGEAILSGSVTKIGSRAFADCGRLCIVYLPDSVTEIAADAFAESSNVVLLCESDNAGAAFARDHDLPYLTGGYTL